MRAARWVPVRWSMVPVDPFEPISTTPPGKAGQELPLRCRVTGICEQLSTPEGDLAGLHAVCFPAQKRRHQKRRYGHALATVAYSYRGVGFRSQNFQAELPSLPRDSKTSASLGTKFRTSKVSFGSQKTNRIFNVLMTSFLRARRIVGTRAETRETNHVAA